MFHYCKVLFLYRCYYVHEIRRKIGDIACEIDLEHQIVFSSMIENGEFFNGWADDLPFFRNVQQEGGNVACLMNIR